MTGRHRSLAAQIVMIQLAILTVAMVAGFGVVSAWIHSQLDHEYEDRALAVAQSVAVLDTVRDGVAAGTPGGAVQRLSLQVARAAGAAYVVVTDRHGIRFSHPNPKLIGTSMANDPEPRTTEPFLTGRPWTGIQVGTLGETARGKAPIRTASGRLVGEVSVGIAVARVTSYLLDVLPPVGLYMLGALVLGALAAAALARRLKRRTFGLELDEIAGLLQEREAMLHGIREAVLGYDTRERVLLANDQARALLGLAPDCLGRPLRELLPPGRLADVVTGRLEGADLPVVHGERVLVANRMPIRVAHRQHLGWVVTLHDRTEPEGLLRELDTVLGLTEALRAQSHEFSNRLHTLVGLVELGQYDEAIGFVTKVTVDRNELSGRLLDSIADPRVVALLLGKISVAAEREVALRVSPESEVRGELGEVGDLLTILGNLVDNAMDAALTGADTGAGHAAGHAPWVEVRLSSVGRDLVVQVSDSGPGVPEAERADIFTDGYTTKQSRTGAHRGLGLALVRQLVCRRGGMIQVSGERGAVFTVLLPRCLTRDPAGAAELTAPDQQVSPA